MDKSISELRKLVSDRITNALLPHSINHTLQGELLDNILIIIDSIINQSGSVFNGVITTTSPAPSESLTGNLSYISTQATAGTYRYGNHGNLTVTIQTGKAPALIFITRINGVWSASIVPLSVNLDHLALAEDLVTTAVAVQDLTEALIAEIEKRTDLGTTVDGEIEKMKTLQRSVEYIKIASIADLDTLNPTYNQRFYCVQIGSGYTDASFLMQTFYGLIQTQILFTPRLLQNGVIENSGSLDKTNIYTRAKNKSQGSWSAWKRIVDDEFLTAYAVSIDDFTVLTNHLPFAEVVNTATILLSSTISAGDVVFVNDQGVFAYRVGTGVAAKYYKNWEGRDKYQDDSSVPISRKYIDSKKNTYWYLQGDMKITGVSLLNPWQNPM